MSVVLHAALIVLGVAVTTQAKETPTHTPPPEVIYRAVVKPAKQPKPVTQTRTRVTPSLSTHVFRVVVPPTTIPTTLPPIDPAAPVVDPTEFSGAGVPEGTVGDAGHDASGGDGTYYPSEVDKQTAPIDGNPRPQYPSMLESAHVAGEVVVQFVVDTTGRVDMRTFTVLEATNELFVDAVKRVLSRWRFYPAEAGGHKVKQLVQMPFMFTVP